MNIFALAFPALIGVFGLYLIAEGIRFAAGPVGGLVRGTRSGGDGR